MGHDAPQGSPVPKPILAPESTWTPEGMLTIAEAKEAKAEVLRRIETKVPFAVDLSRMERMDSAGAQVLIAAARTGQCTITGIPATIQTKLAHTGLLELLGH